MLKKDAYSKEAYLAGTQGLSVPIFSFEKSVTRYALQHQAKVKI